MKVRLRERLTPWDFVLWCNKQGKCIAFSECREVSPAGSVSASELTFRGLHRRPAPLKPQISKQGGLVMEQTRNKSIYVRVTRREKEKINAKANKCGLSLSEYIRQVCLGYEPKEIYRRNK